MGVKTLWDGKNLQAEDISENYKPDWVIRKLYDISNRNIR